MGGMGSGLEANEMLFKDFSEPETNKTGYYIPLSCGHNGAMKMIERTLYEIHL